MSNFPITRVVPFRLHDGAPDARLFTGVPTIFACDEGEGKKATLRRGIEQCTSEFVWLQDADVQPPNLTQDDLLQAIGDADMLIMPLAMKMQNDSTFEQMQRAEYAAIQEVTILAAQRQRPVMCSGANLLVRRRAWLESYDDLHHDLPGGDDMFLLESFKRRKRKIVCHDDARFNALITPQPTLHALMRQRARWASKANRYTDRDIRLCGVLVVLANVLQVFFPPLLLLKFPIECALIRRREPDIPLRALLLLEITYPLYMLSALFSGRRNPQRW